MVIERCKKLFFIAIIAFVLVLCPSSVFAAGYPTFDIENWIYSVMEYYQMIEDAQNFIKQAENQVKQFEKTYEALSQGDLSVLRDQRNRFARNLSSIADSFDDILDTNAELTGAIAGAYDVEIDWLDYTSFDDYAESFAQFGEEISGSLEDYKEEMSVYLSDDAEAYDDSSDSFTSSAGGQSVAQQNAQILKMLDELKAAETTASTQTRLMEEYNEALADAKAAENAFQQKAILSKRYSRERDITSELASKMEDRFESMNYTF